MCVCVCLPRYKHTFSSCLSNGNSMMHLVSNPLQTGVCLRLQQLQWIRVVSFALVVEQTSGAVTIKMLGFGSGFIRDDH